jgi:hypothetical protein
MNRKEGYYWVKYKYKWAVGYYSLIRKDWELCSVPYSLKEGQLDEINETQILPPNN